MSPRPAPRSATKWLGSEPPEAKSLTYRKVKPSVKFCLCWRSSGAEQLPCKQWVGGSNPPASASFFEVLPVRAGGLGEVPKWPKGADCKSAGKRLRGFKSSPPHHFFIVGGNSSVVERQPSKLGVAGSNPVSRSKSRASAHVAQSAERVLGKDEVSGSIPDMGSSFIARVATANG